MLKPTSLLFACILALILGSISLNSQTVVINEFLASNSYVNVDPDFKLYSDWIEIYNLQTDAIDLGGFYLTDNLKDPVKWKFPDNVLIEPGEFLIVWADARDTVINGLHTSFRLSSGGEEIGLASSIGILVDSIIFDAQNQNISFGRSPDGGMDWFSIETPSPGMPNSGNLYLKTLNPLFSLASGFYTEGQLLELSVEDEEIEIRYTTNGDEPDVSSQLYTEPIPLNRRDGEPNFYSEIRTNKDPYQWLPNWIPPAGEVFKGSVVRARGYKVGFNPSDIVTGTFFIDVNIYTRYPSLPVISINCDSEHLFDDQTGIYVPGNHHRSGESGSGNYFQDWEKPAHIEYFEPGGTLGFAQDVGISIQGGTSPASPQKGLHVIARSAYGKNRISYPLFENDPSSANELTEFKRIIIRAWGSLITGSLFNDAYAHRLMASQDLDIQAYRPVVVFINGEYWGLHSMREANKNSWYFQYHYGIDRDDPGYDILLHSKRFGAPYANTDEGDASHWNAMMNYINTNDMSIRENYEYIKTQMDVDNFIAYIGHCIYVGKWDWPNNNDASWRPRTQNGKWRWIQFDMETGFGVATSLGPGLDILGPQLNMFDAAISGIEIPGFGTYGPHPIYSKITDNEEFMETFNNWFIERFDHEFHPDTMNQMLDGMAAEIRPYMPEYEHRWPFIGNIRGDWETSLMGIKDFNNQRQEHVKAQLLDLYNSIQELSMKANLLQNYPNPFTNSTMIYYKLPQAGTVVINIYNSSGQLVASNKRQHSSEGQFSVEFNATGYAGGIYLYTLEGEGFFEVEKMLLLNR